jgi:hypothetical protein
VRGRYLPLGWSPGLCSADERRVADGMMKADKVGCCGGRGGLDDTEAGGGCGGTNEDADGGSWLEDAEGIAKDELGVLGRFEWNLSSPTMDGNEWRRTEIGRAGGLRP